MKSESKLNRFLNGKGFYVALGICMIAIGISAWSTVRVLSPSAENKNGEYDFSSDENLSTENIQSGISDGNNTSSKSSKINNTASQNKSVSEQKSVSSQEKTKNTSSADEAAAPVAKYFVFPVSGEIQKDFSDGDLKYSITYNDWRVHNGIDITAKVGTAVKSAGDGVVTFAGKDEKLGYVVKIDHGNKITAVYAGLNEKLNVKKGDTVKAGDNLAALATVPEECVDAPHLHLEIYDGDKAVSPLSLLSKLN